MVIWGFAPRPWAYAFARVSPGWLRGTASLSFADGRMTIRVENHTEVPAGLDRGEALKHSLLSTHVVGQVEGGRFVSPLEAKGCEQANSWPVLATPKPPGATACISASIARSAVPA